VQDISIVIRYVIIRYINGETLRKDQRSKIDIEDRVTYMTYQNTKCLSTMCKSMHHNANTLLRYAIASRDLRNRVYSAI